MVWPVEARKTQSRWSESSQRAVFVRLPLTGLRFAPTDFTLFGESARCVTRSTSVNKVTSLSQLLTVRVRILLLIILAMTPVVVERISGLQVGRADRIRMAEATMRDLARHGAETYGQTLHFARTLMQAAALTQPENGMNPQSCSRMMGDLSRGSSVVEALSIANPEGLVICSSVPELVGMDISDRSYFRFATTTGSFTVAGMVESRVSRGPVVPAVLPIHSADGKLVYLVIAPLDLSWFDDLLSNVVDGRDLTAFIVDRRGDLVARYPKDVVSTGQNVAAEKFFTLSDQDSAAFTAIGLDGKMRVFASERLGDSAVFIVGADRAQIFRNVDRQVIVAYLVIIAVVVFALVGASWGTERFILRPLRSLVNKAVRYGRGDFVLVPSAAKLPTEFVPLNRALEQMAQQLAARESHLLEENRQLDHLAQVDGLTGIANRRCFDERLRAEWAASAATSRPLSLLMIDVDYFKQFNDHYGHLAGDNCLKAIAASLGHEARREGDFLARYGGEEFALILPSVSAESALDVADRARQAVFDLPLENTQCPLGRITISIGVAAVVATEDQNVEGLIEAADTALYHAKRRGKNAVSARTSRLVDILARQRG